MQIDVNQLKANPLNEKLYGIEELDEDLVKDIKENGILCPIVVDQNNVIISGHTRVKVAKRLGIPRVPVEVRQFNSQADADLALIAYNKTRVKNFTQRQRERDAEKEARIARGESVTADAMTAALQISKGTYHRENTIWEEAKVGNEFAKNQLRLIEEGRTTVSKAYNKIVENRNELRVREARKEQAKLGETLAKSDVLYLGKFQEVLDFIPDGTVDAIITDPPYPYDFIECWTDLAKFTAKKLRPGGWLVAYSGQLHLTEVMARLSIPELNYYWTMALYHNGTKQDVWGIDLNVMWKPILIFTKPHPSSGNAKPKLDSRGHDDYIVSEREEKLGHDWQQSESSVAKLIETFTKPGDFIVEPFAGSGTTIAIAQKLGRKVVGAELDAETFNSAKVRLSELKE